MVIEIKPDIFDGTDFRGMNTLIQTCAYKKRYVLVVDLSKVINTDFYKRLDRDDKEMLTENFNSFILSQSQVKNPKKSALEDVDYSVTNSSTNQL